MASFARKLITKSPLLSRHLTQFPINPARRCLNLHLHLHRRCLTSNPTPNSSSSSSSGLNQPKRMGTLELFNKLYGKHDPKYWKVIIILEPASPGVKGLSRDLTRDQIINEYVKILADVLKSEEEAKKRILSVSTRHAFFFVCDISLETAVQIQDCQGPVMMVEPISETDLKREDYAETGEPFIQGKAVEYDPIFHKAMLKRMYATVGYGRRERRVLPKEEVEKIKSSWSWGYANWPAKEKVLA